MKLNDLALAFSLSLGVLGAAQPADDSPKTATDISQITTNSAAIPDNMVLLIAMTGEPTAADPSPSDSLNRPVALK